MKEIITYIFFAVLLLNVIVSIIVFRRGDLNGFQKATQTFIVWLLPGLGAIGIWLFHRSNDEMVEPNIGKNNEGGLDNYIVGSGGGGSD